MERTWALGQRVVSWPTSDCYSLFLNSWWQVFVFHDFTHTCTRFTVQCTMLLISGRLCYLKNWGEAKAGCCGEDKAYKTQKHRVCLLYLMSSFTFIHTYMSCCSIIFKTLMETRFLFLFCRAEDDARHWSEFPSFTLRLVTKYLNWYSQSTWIWEYISHLCSSCRFRLR